MSVEIKNPIISLLGNIGAGKTTLLKRLENDPRVLNKDFVIVYEPVDLWTKPIDLESGKSDHSILEMFYKDNQRYAFTFQMFTLQTRFENLVNVAQKNPNKILICERCPISDYKIFAQMLYDAKTINNQEFMVYKKWFDMMFNMLKLNIVGIAYLNVPISTCADRIIKRDRKGEDAITIDYLISLNNVHEKWLTLEADKSQYPIYKVEFIDDTNGQVDINKLAKFVDSVCQ